MLRALVTMKDRRTLFKSTLAWWLGLGAVGRARAQDTAVDARKARPQEGDVLVYAFGEKKGETVRVDDLAVSSEQVTCYAKDPATGVVRDGSRLNQVLVLRFDPEQLAEETRQVSADGVVAYSAICTHTGCDISMWEEPYMICSCHETEFDPRDSAVVVSGPAPRRLPYLPLKQEEGVLIAAGGFSATIHFQKEL